MEETTTLLSSDIDISYISNQINTTNSLLIIIILVVLLIIIYKFLYGILSSFF